MRLIWRGRGAECGLGGHSQTPAAVSELDGVLLGKCCSSVHRPRPSTRGGVFVDATTVEEPGSKAPIACAPQPDSSRCRADVSITDAHVREFARFRGQADTIHIADWLPLRQQSCPPLAAYYPLSCALTAESAGRPRGGAVRCDRLTASSFRHHYDHPSPRPRCAVHHAWSLPGSPHCQSAAPRDADHARNEPAPGQEAGRTLRDETLYACGFMLLLTNLPAAQ